MAETEERWYVLGRLLLWLVVIASLLFVTFKLWQAVASGFEGNSVRELTMILSSPISLILVVGAAANAFLLPAVHRFNQRLRTGRHGNYAGLPIAPSQPNTDASTLTLPLTITLRSRSYAKIAVFVLSGLMMSLTLAVIMFSFLAPAAIASNELTMMDLMVPIGTSGFFTLIALVAGLRQEQETLEITEHGLYLRQNSSPEQNIRWDDVRLLAVSASAGGKHNPVSMAYILASPSASVTWSRIHRLTWYIYLRPIIPLEEYNRQMETLLSQIAARTGLPLYDLR